MAKHLIGLDHNFLAGLKNILLIRDPKEMLPSFLNQVKEPNIQETALKDQFDLMKELQEKYMVGAEKFIFICPEYNGSFPGILKLLIDASDVSQCWYHKKACIVGVAAGRAGNLRGLDHLSNILHHIKITILPNLIPISMIEDELDETGNLINPRTIKLLKEQPTIQELLSLEFLEI